MEKITKSVLTLVLACFSGMAVAQIPNPGFETWNNMGNYSNPDQWDNLNSMTASSAVYTCQQGSPGSPGASYLKLTSKTVTGMGVMPGIAVSGKIDMMTFKPKSGFAFSGQPATLTGKYQYMNSGGDLASVSVTLTRWDAAMKMRDTIATSFITFNGMLMSWSTFTATLVYKSSAVPDSAVIILSSSGASPVNGSMLYIDNLAFAGSATGIKEAELDNAVILYPNPACDQLNVSSLSHDFTIESIEIFSLQGREIRAEKFKTGGYLNIIDVSTLSSGAYFLKLSTAKGNTMVKKFLKN